MLPYRPATAAPALAGPRRSVSLGSIIPFTEFPTAPAAGDPAAGAVAVAMLLRTGISGAMSWAGIYAGIHGHGLLRVAGWGVGVLGGLSAVASLIASGVFFAVAVG
jgi:hypothetical protein